MSKMAKKFTAVIGLVLLLILVFLGGRWTGGSHVPEDRESEETVAAAPTEDAETIWTCSMHPQVRQPEPGQCPICGMDLIPLTSDEDAGEESDLPRLRVSERSAALMNVETWPVERREVEREVRLLGRVNYDERRVKTVTAWIAGRLDRVFVDVEGAAIQRGERVAEVYSPGLITAQEELLQAIRSARARDAGESPMVEAARDRLRLLGLDTHQIQAIEERGTVQDHVEIYSPLDGVILERVAVEGSYVEAGDRIAVLAALDQVFVDLEAYERDLPWLAEGQDVRFSVEALGGRTFEGTVDQINPFLDPGRRTAQVRVLVDNADGALKPGMFAGGVVVARLGGPEGLPRWRENLPLIIPSSAALITGRRAVVYVKVPDTDRPTFELREVDLGPRAGDTFVVREGLSEGELVVIQGNFKIDSELQLRGRPSMMAPEGGEPAEHDHSAMDLREVSGRNAFADEVDPAFATEIGPVVSAYLDVVGALADDDSAAARRHLEAVAERLRAIGPDRFSGQAETSWKNTYMRLEGTVQAMREKRDLSGLREYLQELTRLVETVYVAFGRGELPRVYRAYCPMAHDGDGATWLQEEKAINNPYFGASMASCGEIRGRLVDEEGNERK